MATNQIYKRIMAEMPDGLERVIMLILSNHIGGDRRISKANLYWQVTHAIPAMAMLKKDTLDRQVRQAIENLRLAGYPVLSDSGQGGYWIGTKAEVAEFAQELESRTTALVNVTRALRASNKLQWIDPKPPARQASLF